MHSNLLISKKSLAWCILFAIICALWPSFGYGQNANSGEEGIADQQLEVISPNVRDVTPKGVYRGQDWRSRVIRRLPARKYSEQADTPQTTEQPIKVEGQLNSHPLLWKQTRIISSGQINSAGSTDGSYGPVAITLAGITPLKTDAACEDIKNGSKWVCGRFAKGDLNRLVRGRPISCAPNFNDEKKKTITSRCTIDGRDISIWLVSHGWAVPLEKNEKDTFNKELNAALKSAKSNRVGQWSRQKPDLIGRNARQLD